MEYIDKNQLFLQDLVARMPHHVYWMNKDNIYLGCNDVQAKRFGLNSPKEIVGRSIYELFPQGRTDALAKNNKQVIKLGIPKTFEESYVTPDGNVINYLSFKSPLKDKGKIIGIIGISIDITRQKQLEDELKEAKKQIKMLEKDKHNMLSEIGRHVFYEETDPDISATKLSQNISDYLDSIISSMPCHLYWMDCKGHYLGCNDAQVKYFGLTSRNEIMGKTNKELFKTSPPQVVEMLDRNNLKVITTGKTEVFEESALYEDERVKSIYLSSKAPLRNKKGEIIGLIGISVDIAERKQIEEDYLHNFEYDIRTPFNGIYGLTDILLGQEKDSKKKEWLLDIKTCAKELLGYCNSLLDFSKVESCAIPVQLKCFNLHELLTDIKKMELPAVKAKQLKFSLHFDKQAPSLVLGDRYRMHRILLNIVSNAIKFTAKGYVKLAVKQVGRTNGRNIVLQFSVADSGMGIPKDKQDVIYDRFRRLTPRNQGIYKGHGLGLRIVKQFVEELDGDIHVESEANKGAKFVVEIPVRLPLDS